MAKGKTFVTYRFLAYVPLHLKSEYQALGWRFRDENPLAGTHHGDWSDIGEYISDRDEEPPTPKLQVLR